MLLSAWNDQNCYFIQRRCCDHLYWSCPTGMLYDTIDVASHSISNPAHVRYAQPFVTCCRQGQACECWCRMKKRREKKKDDVTSVPALVSGMCISRSALEADRLPPQTCQVPVKQRLIEYKGRLLASRRLDAPLAEARRLRAGRLAHRKHLTLLCRGAIR